MADSKKPSTASSLLSTTNSLLSTKNSTLSSSSLFQNSSLLTSSTLNTTSSLLSGTNTNKQSSLFSPSSSLLSTSTLPKPSFSSSLLNTSLTKPSTSSSFFSTTKLPTSNTLLSSFTSNSSSLLTTDTSLSKKRKAESLESTIVTKPIIQGSLKKSTVTTTTAASTTVSISNENDYRYNAENIQPIQSQSIHLDVDLHCDIPAPKRPRIDPFNSIFARLENQTTTDEEFNIGIKSIKKSLLNSLADSLLSQPDLRKATDSKRNELIRLANLVVEHDPEFILKVKKNRKSKFLFN